LLSGKSHQWNTTIPTFHYTRRITHKRVTSMRGRFRNLTTCADHVEAVANHLKHAVKFGQSGI